MILLERIQKIYQTESGPLNVLQLDELSFVEGGSYAIVGPSGSGKSTLLTLIAGLDRPTSGSIGLFGTSLASLSENEIAKLRNRSIGYIFQSFQLLENLTALENVMVPAEILGTANISERARELLKLVGLSERLNHFPSQLSGGEQQRVAIARAFINSPKLILADEPTGNLDIVSAERVQKILLEMNSSQKTTLIVATHDLDFASKLGVVVRLHGGKVIG